jgi:hypothetical protein
MGAWSGLCIFDHAAFTNTVIPALQAGENHPIVRRAIELVNIDGLNDLFATSDFQGLRQVVSACDPKMISCSLGRKFYVQNGQILLDKENVIKDGEWWDYEDFTALFEILVTCHAITHYYVFGLRKESFFWQYPFSRTDRDAFDNDLDLHLERLGFDPIVWTLLDSLDRWGDNYSYWAHGSGGYGEGIQGWLSPEETELLFVALEDFPECCLTREEDEMRWKEISIFKNIVQMAVEFKQGLLWGIDLGLFYNRVEFDENEVKPIDLENKFDW